MAQLTPTRSWTLADVATITADLARLERQLFVTLGNAARSTAPPLPPDVLATWCHRHAWHVELWEQRSPIVAGWFGADPPPTWPATADIDRAVAALAGADPEQLPTVASAAVATLDRALTLIAERLDGTFDPATARVVALVRTDVDQELAVFAVASGGDAPGHRESS